MSTRKQCVFPNDQIYCDPAKYFWQDELGSTITEELLLSIHNVTKHQKDPTDKGQNFFLIFFVIFAIFIDLVFILRVVAILWQFSQFKLYCVNFANFDDFANLKFF